jgi:predicted nucleic acid-binding protein
MVVERGLGPLLTSNHVVGETWTFLRRRHGHDSAVGALRALREVPSLTVLHVEQDADDDAWRWLARRDEREYSFVDATSFAVMRRRRMREALAFDGDFSAAGFVELRP